MISGTRIIADLYRDSVSLMRISAITSALPGVIEASCIMATPANLELLKESGLLVTETAAKPSEVLIIIKADNESTLNNSLASTEAELRKQPKHTANGSHYEIEPPNSQEMALKSLISANLALISTPGHYATAEAIKALHLGLNVMIFSDNVTIEDEIELKTYAKNNSLMVLGPDCGTAVIDGVPLGFSNVVRKGNIGVIAASGTGLQQVICLIDSNGGGVSQAIGTGGRDLDARIGGITMMQGINALASDPETKVIVLVSKPPSPDVADAVIKLACTTGKPIVVCLLNSNTSQSTNKNIHHVKTLEDAATAALSLSRCESISINKSSSSLESLLTEAPEIENNRKYLRALYSGGTFCYEALTLLKKDLSPLSSNMSFPEIDVITDPWESLAHTLIDLGDDVFTRGRPHPMIDHRLRNERLIKEASDPETAVILIDVVLGYGAHSDPAAAMTPALAEARSINSKSMPIIVGFICGTEADPQNIGKQKSALIDNGVLVASCNAEAVRLASKILEKLK